MSTQSQAQSDRQSRRAPRSERGAAAVIAQYIHLTRPREPIAQYIQDFTRRREPVPCTPAG
jgi:hypothetical protein